MTRSTRSNGLPRLAALLFALALATGWVQSGLASTTVEAGGGQPDAAPFVADTRFETAPVSNVGWLAALHEQRDDLRAAAAIAVEPKPASTPVVKAAAAKPPKPTYAGTNRFWIPSLGMSNHVYWFACTRSRDPDNLIYRWGCAGANNVYILGHAYGVMKPLHDAYVRGALHDGMVAIYADGKGHVHWYKVVSWRVVDPSEAAWAIASQPVPSMTLQTCVGKDGQYRLNVRLVQYKVT